MRRLALLTFATLFGVTALAEGLLDCIAPDVLRALLLQAQGERPPIITAAVPVELSPLKMPREFTWIGSAERIQGRVDASTNLSQVTAAWRSSLAPDAARAAAATALTASGWEVRPVMATTSPFSSPLNPAQTACRDNKPVNVTISAMDGVTYALVAIQRGNNNTICNQPVRLEPLAGSGLDKVMPKLDLPADPATGGVARQQGSSWGSSSGVSTAQVQFAVKDSVGNVAKHFAKQMTAQGWSSDAAWSGTATAGSTWLKRSDASTVIQGTLSVTALDDRQFMATLRVMKLQ